MTNWWDAAPLADQSKDGNWWDAAPLARESKPSGPTVGIGEALARGAAQGITAGFYDEAVALSKAGGADQKEPSIFGGDVSRMGVDHLIMGLAKYWFGDKDAQAKYDEAVKGERAFTKAAEEQHPIASTVGNVAGAVAVPLGAGGNAATLPLRMARGAGVGAVMGGVGGVGEGEGLADSVGKGVTGAAVGGALGGVAPAAVEGLIRGGRAVAEPIVNAVRGVRNVDDEAARRVATAVERDIRIDPNAERRLTPQEYAAGVRAGDPVANVDVGGETTRALARSAANTSAEARQALSGTIDDRFEGQGPRVVEWLNRNFNYPDAGVRSEQIATAARMANRPAYAKAYSEGQSLWDDGLEQLSQAPVMQQAIRMAFVTGRNKDALAGFPPIKNPFSMNRETGQFELAQGATPNLQFWDHVKRNLDKMGAEGQAFSKALRGHLDELVPSYRDARAGAAKAFGAEDALEAGQKFVSSKMDTREAARAMAKLSPLERKVFQDGFISEFTNKLNQLGDRRTVLNQIAESPAARQRLDMVLGPQKAQELEAMLRIEGIMDIARGAVQGNSTTARQLAEIGLAGGAYGLSGGGLNPLSDPGAVMSAAVAYGAARGRNKVNENLAKRVGEMLASQDPAVFLRGIKVVANNKQLFNALRGADQGLARIGGGQAGGVPALQIGGVSRAEDEQNVPRPVSQ